LTTETNSLAEQQRAYGVPALLEGAGDIAGIYEDLERIRARVASGRLAGLATGLSSIDAHMGGLQAGLHLLAAEPSIGKTTMALQFSLEVAKSDGVALFFAFDESAERLAVKVAAQVAGAKASEIMNGKGDLDALKKAVEINRDLLDRVRLFGASSIDPAHISAMVQELMELKQTGDVLVVVDFVQSLAARLTLGKNDFRVAVTELVGQLRKVVRECRVPVLAITAQNRTNMDTANMSSLRESSDLEYGADSISFLTNDGDESDKKLEKRPVLFTCAKSRYGERFSVPLDFFAARGVFRERR
jgi:replicative DNA helicase